MGTHRSVLGAVALSMMSLLFIGPGSASAESPACTQMAPNTSMFFYKKSTGDAGTGTLAAGRWQYRGVQTGIPAGYSHAAASRDSLVLYNTDTGALETGTFINGVYTRSVAGHGATAWTHVEATGDSVLFYNAATGRAASGTLRNGAYRELRAYDNFSKGWASIAGSCDTIAFVKNVGKGDLPNYELGYGTLRGGVYTMVGFKSGMTANELVATKDSIMLRIGSASGDSAQFASLAGGSVGQPHSYGTSGHWDAVGRSADSLFFYKADGTAWISTLNGNRYANVGPLGNVSPGWSIIEGGV